MGPHSAGIWPQSVLVRHALRPPTNAIRVSCAAQVAQEIFSCVDRRDPRVDVEELTGVSRVASNVRAKAFGTNATDAERAACSSHCQPAVEG
jgi:hypothetical protein